MARSTARQNRPCQPTDASVLSACAQMTATPACAARYAGNLTDAALAVSVFAFISWIAIAIGVILVPLVALTVVALVYRLYTVYRLCYSARLFARDYAKQNFPCTSHCVAFGC